MRIFAKKTLREFWLRHPDAEPGLQTWYTRTKKAQWENLAQLKATFPSADLVGICVVFNIAGNKYRLITKIYFGHQKVYVRA
ncbi:MAG TPA: type II toxin-antitoxin system HigB family toxin, partial [Blastocatellia bacterium]